MKIVSFVILHYGDLETTDLCVSSILRMDQQERIRIVIVDNDVKEAPESRQRIQDRYRGIGRITVLPVMENGGFSYANNLGYAYARDVLGASFIVVVNNDIEFHQKDFIERLDRAYREHPAAVLGPDVVRKSTGEHQNPLDVRLRTRLEAERTARMNEMALKCYGLIYPFLYLNRWRLEKASTKARRAADTRAEEAAAEAMTGKASANARAGETAGAAREGVVLFGAILIFTPLFTEREEKAFWPETGFYYEEYILAARCRKHGYRMAYVPQLQAFHESGKATKRSFGSEKKRLRFEMEHIAESARIYQKYLGKRR